MCGHQSHSVRACLPSMSAPESTPTWPQSNDDRIPESPKSSIQVRSIVLLRIVINSRSIPTKVQVKSYQKAAACFFLIHLHFKLRPLCSKFALLSPNSYPLPHIPSPLHTHIPHKRVEHLHPHKFIQAVSWKMPYPEPMQA